MAKLQGNKIDASRDPRRQPLPKESELLAKAEISPEPFKPTPKWASKSSDKATTVVPSSKEPSKTERKPEFSSGTGQPFTPERSTSRSKSTKTSTPNKNNISSTTISPSVAQKNAAHHNTPERGRRRLTGRAHAKSPTPSPFHIGSPGTSMLHEAGRIVADVEVPMTSVPNQLTLSVSDNSVSTSKSMQKLPKGSSPSLKQQQTVIQPVSTAMLSETKIKQKKKVETKELKTNLTSKKVVAEDHTKQKPVKKPNPLYTDTSERLRRDSEIETQYIKGIGEVIIRHGPDTNSDAKPATPRVLDNESFPVKSYLSKLRSVHTRYMKWISGIDGFEIILNASETITIPAKAISSISYNYECKKFYLSSNDPTTSADHLEESILEVRGDQHAPSKLKSLFERRLSGFKVHMVEIGFFDTKEHAFQRLDIRSLPLPSTPGQDDVNLISSDGPVLGVSKDLKALQGVAMVHQKATQAPGILPQAMETNLANTIRVQPSSENKTQVPQDTDPDHAESQLTLPVSKARRVTTNHSMRRKRKPTEPAALGVTPSEVISRHWLKMTVIDKSENPNLEPGGQLHARRISEASAHRVSPISSSPPSQAAEADLSQILLYNSKDRVRRNDLVIRIRDAESMEGGHNKHDRLDVYDGPFRISRLPKLSGLSDSRKNVEKNNISVQALATSSGATHTERMKDELVKLHFPNNSKGKALTKLGRLRPVFEVPEDVPVDCDARSRYKLAEIEGHERRILNTLVLDKESDNDKANTKVQKANTEVQGVCRVQKGAYVKVEYIAQEGPVGDNLFEVEKLRGKRVDRHSLKEFPDEKMDDSTILRYLEGGGYLEKSQVLVVKYLVHWAGWPSEDDTWERAQGNIPQDFIDQYNASMPDPEVVIADLPNKRRKSESLGAKQFVKGS
ncbi:hypothetical protein MMC17_001585 [Xylographa soralifera]|nr:hypothetical protein [Xylographa soralifera]